MNALLSAPDSKAQPVSGAQIEQAAAPSPVENHTQLEKDDEGEIISRGNRTADGVHGGDAVRATSGRTELPSVAARNPETEGVSSGKTDVEIHRDDVLPAGVCPGNVDGRDVGGRTERRDVARAAEPDSLSATLARLGSAPGFDGKTFAEFATSEPPVDVAATRGELPVTVTKQTIATRGKSRPVVEAVKSSKGTWQFRLRWNSEPGRPVHYVATVADSTYEMIRKGDYEGYKKALIADYEASAISAD